MNCRITDMNNKQVINISDGSCLGFVNDIEIDTCCAKVIAIVVYGRPKCLGLFGRHEDIVIPWCNIHVIGEDTVLVKINNCDCSKSKPNGPKIIEKLFED